MSTNPKGRSFLSYKRERRQEAEKLIEAQHERGIPTWQDISDLGVGVVLDRIRSALGNSETANALVWLTPEVRESPTILREEIPLILERAGADDEFFVIPVAAGGLERTRLGELFDDTEMLDDIQRWNIERVSNDPASLDDVQAIANKVLEERLKAIVSVLAPEMPLMVGVYGANAPATLDYDLLVDWSHCFEQNKCARSGAWQERIIPAARELRDALARYATQRPIHLTGYVSLPAMTVLGAAFSETTALQVAWFPPKAPSLRWSIEEPRKDPGIQVEKQSGDVASNHLAVLVDAIGNIDTDFRRATATLPKFRATLRIKPPRSSREFRIQSSGEAAEFAWRVREGIHEVRAEYPGITDIHLFTKVPAGLAFMIGQLLNPFGKVHLYDHLTEEDRPYREAICIVPHARELFK